MLTKEADSFCTLLLKSTTFKQNFGYPTFGRKTLGRQAFALYNVYMIDLRSMAIPGITVDKSLTNTVDQMSVGQMFFGQKVGTQNLSETMLKYFYGHSLRMFVIG